jgi:hypothetical protein
MLTHLGLKHVGPSDALEMELSPRVNLITGDNGLGKSFLLDVAWWVLTRTWAHYPALPDPRANEAAQITFAVGDAGASHAYALGFDRSAQQWKLARGRPPKHGMVLYARVDGGFSVWDPARNYWRNAPTRGVVSPDRPAAFNFSPAEVWDGVARESGADRGRVEWLCEGLIRDWASWQREGGSSFAQLTRVLERLTPSADEPLVPGELTRISLQDASDVPLVHASAAVRRVVSLAYLLVWTWREHRRAAELLGEEPTREVIFLIDEIEAHLFPAWQRRILPSLMEVVRALTEEEATVQLIVVTHSPMVLASMEPHFDAGRDSLWYFDLQRPSPPTSGRATVRLTKSEWHRHGDAAAWLRSEVFDLKEARSLEAERAIERARAMMAGESTPTREAFDDVYLALRRTMPGVDPFWVDWRVWAWGRGLLRPEAAE